MVIFKRKKVLSLIFLFTLYTCIYAATINDTKTLLSNLLSDYNTDVRPIEDQFSAINVTVTAYIKSIQEFDEVQEKFSFVGALAVTWQDANMVWNPYHYGGLYQLSVSYKNVWVPELILSSPSEDVNSLGKSWNKVRYYSSGIAVWVPIDLIESTCAVNVRNYPFDTQECVTSFNSMGYEEAEVLLIPGKTEFDFSVYQENSLWAISGTKVSVQTVGASSQIDLVVSLKRKPSFVIINVILPILFLSLLNILVFILVPESGERISYCITVLLAVAVFMTIVSDMLPRSSEPVPLISYKLMIDMILSSLIVVVAVLNLRVYNKDKNTPVPKWLQALYCFLSCRKCQGTKVFALRKEGKSGKIKAMSINEDTTTNTESKLRHLSEAIERIYTITWKKISFMIDWISFVTFTVASFLSFVCFIAATVNN
ncbi:neuronal acetylcholine receptor subunit alpha-6-like [Mercenaria mercenaria]|uniref:neuronal acetylcholine receptor subunit alpha-6-like n=1 Tax=Mercenaria mercenaria TaxID=6596 RepID=UPI00234E7299|nr:neuronal acetylcholine receptor subunit alpha-6-like [Mercenaria mercenaria]